MYSVELTPAAVRDYKKLPHEEVERINEAVESLSGNPRPAGYKKLKSRNAYRVRVGDYRIIYEINQSDLIVAVVRIRHRREVYRDIT